MNSSLKVLCSLSFLFMSMFAKAQTYDKIEMAEGLYASGKIYVVVAVLLVILSGIFLFLIRIDRKVKKLENSIQKK